MAAEQKEGFCAEKRGLKQPVVLPAEGLFFMPERLYTLSRSAHSEGVCITGCPDGYTLSRSAHPEGVCITGCPDGYNLAIISQSIVVK